MGICKRPELTVNDVPMSGVGKAGGMQVKETLIVMKDANDSLGKERALSVGSQDTGSGKRGDMSEQMMVKLLYKLI